MASETTETPVASARPPRGLLFVDTSSLLDLVRDITRETDVRRMVRAADALLAAARREEIEILLPAQVVIELQRNLEKVERDSDAALKRHWRRGRAVESELVELGLGGLGGALPPVAVEHYTLENVRLLRRGRLDEWRSHAEVLKPEPATLSEAVARLNLRQPPAHEEKAEFADCLIIETVFAEIEQRGGRAAIGGTVFLSANTQDYGLSGSSSVLRPPLDEQFEQRGLRYAANFWHAAHLLGVAAKV